MDAAACITLGAMHAIIWFRQRSIRSHLLFSCCAYAAALVAGFELTLLHAATPEEYSSVLRWGHIPVCVMVISLIWFVRLYLQAGRLWLAWMAAGARLLALVLNFTTGQSLNYRQMTGLAHTNFFGEVIAMPIGVPNPMMIVGQLSSILFLCFLIDATKTVWQRGDRRRAIVVGGSMIVFIVVAAGHLALLNWGVIHSPYYISFCFLAIVIAMGYELSFDVFRAADLSRNLQRSEALLHESEMQLGLAIEGASLGILTRDLIRNEIKATERWMALFGFGTSEEIEVDSYLTRIHPDDRDSALRAWTRAIEGGGKFETEYRTVHPDGKIRWIGSRGRVETNGDGKPVFLRSVSVDVSERKRVELEVQQQRSELAHLSRVTMLGELSGSLAHELNQPLTAILSNAQAAQRFIAQDHFNLEEVRAILNDIVEDDKRAGEVIRRLRLLLKKGELQQHPVDLSQIIRDVLKLVNSDLLNHGVTAEVILDPHLPAVQGDRVQLQQVLLNLIMNGCDAMATVRAGDRKLSLQAESANGDGVTIVVSDQGTGIPADQVERLFEPFFTTKQQGMGLGLTVCRTIISAHGGRLWAKNNDGRGASFYIVLPVQETEV